MEHRILTFSTCLRSLLILTSVCIAGAVTGSLKAGEFEDNAYRVVSPQVVATSDIETTFILSNPLFRDTCEVRVSYDLGGGTKPGFPILTNGEDLGHDFTIHLEGATFGGDAGFTPLKVTTNGDAFVGATTFLIERACGPRVRVVTQYLIPGGPSGFENFSSSDADVVTLNRFADCATFFWQYAAGSFDNGLAIVSDGNPDTDLDIAAFSGGALIDSVILSNYDGSHRARLISEDLDTIKLAEAGEGAFRVCVVDTSFAPISVLALGLVQAGVIQPQAGAIGAVQFALALALKANAERLRGKHVLDLEDRFQVVIKRGEEVLRDPEVIVDGSSLVIPGDPEVRVVVSVSPSLDKIFFRLTIQNLDSFPDDWTICILDDPTISNKKREVVKGNFTELRPKVGWVEIGTDFPVELPVTP